MATNPVNMGFVAIFNYTLAYKLIIVDILAPNFDYPFLLLVFRKGSQNLYLSV